MSSPATADLWAALEATWPPASETRAGPWRLRDGAGGGKRVSAAIADGPVEDIATAPPLIMVRAGAEALDTALAGAGYAIVDPTVILAGDLAPLAAEMPPPVTGFTTWPPLRIQRELWGEGGIGPARLAVMDRAPASRTALLGRTADKPAATAFAAIHGRIAMVHALEVRPDLRRRGVGRTTMIHAARWAAGHGATTLALAVTRANGAALALYAALGLVPATHYHYRVKEPADVR